MSGGFQVVIADLQKASAAFHAEAKTFLTIMPEACPALPDAGSGAVNGALSAVVDAACLLHLQISGDMDNNGSKLQTAHDRYQHTEESLTTLSQQIASPDQIK